MSSPVFPINTEIPCLSWSVFDTFRWTCTRDGSSLLSMAISAGVRWTAGSNVPGGGLTISPSLKKSKNAMVQAAHNIMVSGCVSSGAQRARIRRRMSGVIGSRWRSFAALAVARVIPPLALAWRQSPSLGNVEQSAYGGERQGKL